jgi:hypothetical protein
VRADGTATALLCLRDDVGHVRCRHRRAIGRHEQFRESHMSSSQRIDTRLAGDARRRVRDSVAFFGERFSIHQPGERFVGGMFARLD